MKIALIEPNIGGHHLTYLLAFHQALQKLGHQVTIYTTATLQIENRQIIRFHKMLMLPKQPIRKKITVVINLFLTLLNLWEVRTHLEKKTDLLFFCCMDDYMSELLPRMLFSKMIPFPFTGLFLSPRNKGKYLRLDRRNILSSAPCQAVAVLDEFCQEQLTPYQPNIVQFPDFTDESAPNQKYELVTQILKKANGRCIISLLGALHARKGIHTFIQTAGQMDPNAYFFVMAGKSYLTKEELQEIEYHFANRSNCLFANSRIPSEADFNRLIEISHIVYAAYVDFSQSSNMFAKSAFFQKPVIVSKGYYMEEIVQHYRTGIAIQSNDPQACMEAICELQAHTIAPTHYQAYLAKHSVSQLPMCFQQLLSYYSL